MTGTGAGTGADDYSHDAMLCWDAFYIYGYHVWTGAGCTGTEMDWDGTIIARARHGRARKGARAYFAGYIWVVEGQCRRNWEYMRSRVTTLLLVRSTEELRCAARFFVPVPNRRGEEEVLLLFSWRRPGGLLLLVGRCHALLYSPNNASSFLRLAASSKQLCALLFFFLMVYFFFFLQELTCINGRHPVLGCRADWRGGQTSPSHVADPIGRDRAARAVWHRCDLGARTDTTAPS